MNAALILFGVFFLLLFLNVPISISLAVSSILTVLACNLPLSMVATNLYTAQQICPSGNPLLHSGREHHGCQRHFHQID